MEILTKSLIWLHVFAGSIALLAAVLAISLRKGSPRHNLVGLVYFGAMMAVAITALPVSIIRPNLMLFFVALFSAYMAYAGWRFGKQARYITKRPPIIEWGMLLVGAAMILTGLIQVFSSNSLGWVLVAFGAIGLMFAVQDLRGWGQKVDFGQRISNHLSHMLAGTIATVTAVLVQQVVPRLDHGSPFKVIVWLAPTLIITPLIVIWARKVRTTQKVRLFSAKLES